MFESLDILQLLKPELVVLIPGCWGFGLLLKSIQVIPNKFIPLILCGISILLTLLYILGNDSQSNIYLKLFTVITQGIGYWAIAWVSYAKFIKMGIKLSVSSSTETTNNEDPMV